ncbi:carboxypeptidase-like regulatory domain-containing protein [Aquipseudomonas alcaligenes]|uniref:carboxypeptidase-like regulatory domain-containing protein n=1 Tax=Aquipseudomonas alcaligenes TaxID=43263 RepID=UPI00117A50A8|nr:carboxypeptidase-like regulatory domain-containing protein [Pseudomonas alcaligenes]
MLSAETGQAVADARIELDIGSDESWRYETSSDSEGRFAFAKHRDYRLFALLADGPHCRTDIKVNAPGYHTRHCIWISSYGCSSAPIKISGLMLRPEHMAVSEIESVEGYWLCLESAKEQAH